MLCTSGCCRDHVSCRPVAVFGVVRKISKRSSVARCPRARGLKDSRNVTGSSTMLKTLHRGLAPVFVPQWQIGPFGPCFDGFVATARRVISLTSRAVRIGRLHCDELALIEIGLGSEPRLFACASVGAVRSRQRPRTCEQRGSYPNRTLMATGLELTIPVYIDQQRVKTLQ